MNGKAKEEIKSKQQSNYICRCINKCMYIDL